LALCQMGEGRGFIHLQYRQRLALRPPPALRRCDPRLALGGPAAGRVAAVKSAAPLAGLDPDQTGSAFPGPGAAARPVFAPER
jgi:hypothetical protein